jgi:hypothetical protein
VRIDCLIDWQVVVGWGDFEFDRVSGDGVLR